MKLAKFALACDGEKVTSLDQLKEHFNLLDILEHYKSGTLHRWLKSRGYASELEGVEAIKATEDADILNALCGVFGIEADLETINAILKDHEYAKEQERLQAEIKAQQKTLIPIATQEQALVPLTAQNALVTPPCTARP
ncbi:hypothetical protein NHP190003_13070 [Helicobacter sp. NHP19-003]|uniref:Uncharacterized protein n=1 Tax=Helicobacter gastrocanis TaxID=2849641 RepID=A0ABM7SA81_9HELI|nr:hypothetical protein [Helicobacter sp. NHP19-003]BCZ17487.1 hypothetical protein NHP190003_07690 [Helicobacter sp. NHP19-003]BCZ18025.1 hypothetical protein NHP190003_13070 [Helicobacter sp. NHP19-003]